MHQDSAILTNREVEAVRIPSGEKIKLASGTPVVLTQALGGSFTVLVPSQGGLFRIEGVDADALGKQILPDKSGKVEPGVNADEKIIWEQLKTCYDPEIPVNIVDLGLIYSLELKPHAGGGSSVAVKMTLTAQGCGMGPSIAADARSKILQVSGVRDASVDLVWDPPWSPALISAEGKAKLGMA